MVGSVIEEGVYVTPVGFNFNAADDLIGDDVTFVTLGEIDFNGGSSAFRPYFGGLLMITEGFSPAGQCDNNPVIQLTGSNINWGGIIYAPNGQISMNIAGGGSFYGSIIAGTIDVSVASLILIADQQYKSVESDFSNNTAETIFTLILPYPTADAGGPYMVGEGSSIQLDASGSSGLNLSDYDWDFDSDGMYDDASGITVTFGNTADDAIYPIGLRVSNSYGFTDTAVTSVTVNNVAPTLANLTTTAPISESESVTLTGTIVDPGSQDTFTMTVDWADGEQDTLFYPTNTTNFTLSHQYLDDAPTPSDTYTITLTVNDKDGGSDSAELPVQVVNSPPAVDAGTGQEVLVHTPIYVSGTFTDLGPLDSHTISWDFGDGTVLTGSLTATHAFENAGLYTVTLTIVDDDGGFGSDSLIVVVTNYAVFMPVTPHQPLNETND
jgi:PKD repeat protein